MSSHSNHQQQVTCNICNKAFARHDLVRAALVSEPIAQTILKDHSNWSAESYICRPDLARYRGKYVHSLLESERGELTQLEQQVLMSLKEHELLSKDVDRDFDQKWSRGEKLADDIATFGGSWSFIILFGIFIVIWIAMNSLVFLWRPVDPYPYILLNLVLSCLAALQAPVIMMSQNGRKRKIACVHSTITRSISKRNSRSGICTRKSIICYRTNGSGWCRYRNFSWSCYRKSARRSELRFRAD